MAKPKGIDSVGIAAAFTACIQVAGHFDRDYGTQYLSLRSAKLRLTNWGEAVKIILDPSLSKLDVDSEELEMVKHTVDHLQTLFAEIAKNHLPKTQTTKGPSDSELEHLIRSITSLIDGLEALFPESRCQPAVTEKAALLDDERTPPLVQSAARDVKPLFQAVTSGHTYSNLEIDGEVQFGDVFDPDWTGDASGKSHRYHDLEFGPNAKVRLGNKYGGKGFWHV